MEVDTQTKKMESTKKSPELKHLSWLWITLIELSLCIWKLYLYSKEKFGTWRSTVDAVERAVTAVVAPVCRKYEDVPENLLVFADRKVAELIHHFDRNATPSAKKTASIAKAVADIAMEKCGKLVNEAREGGSHAAMKYTVAEAKHLAVDQTVKLYIKLDQHPVIHTILAITLPTAAHWSEKHNEIVTHLSQKGHQISGYLPLVPIDEITKTYKQNKPEKKEDAAEHEDSLSDYE